MTEPFAVPITNLDACNRAVWGEILRGWTSVVDRGDFILGSEVGEFEREFATFSGLRHCVGVGNGTDALELALRAVRVRPANEVVLPANTFIATALAVMRSGARPVLVDVDDESLALDQDRAIEAITIRTRAVIPVHLYGHVAATDRLLAALPGTGVELVEDAAQAHGARLDGQPVGGAGAIAATSFYPSKNLGAFGDGGAVITDRIDLADTVRSMRDYGRTGSNNHGTIGFNSRLDTIQAVVLRAKLQQLASWTIARAAAADRYGDLLGEVEQVRLPVVLTGASPAWHLYVVRVPRRDEVLRSLRARGIEAAVHYPVPIHLQPSMKWLGLDYGQFPVAEAAAKDVLSLPLFPAITENQQTRVADALIWALR